MVTEALVQHLTSDTKLWIESLLSIPTREGEIVDFQLSNFQEEYVRIRSESGHKLRRVLLKPRQIFASTIILACNFMDCVTKPGTRVLTLTHHDDATELFRLTIRHWCNQLKEVGLLPEIETDNANLLAFKNMNSHMVFQTAGGRFGGRSSAFNRIHMSEVAHWPGDPYKIIGGIIPSAPQNAEIDMESTANGAEGPFHDFYVGAKTGENEWQPIFWPWYNNPLYVREYEHDFEPTIKEQQVVSRYGLTLEQLSWRRWMESELKKSSLDGDVQYFGQEYPEDDIRCFLTGISNVLDAEVLEEMVDMMIPPIMNFEGWDIWKPPHMNRPYVIGADSSEGKGDWSVGTVLDAVSLETVARFRNKLSPTQFSKALYDGHKMYNDALLTVETPGPGALVMDRLMFQYGVTNLYYYQDDTTGKVNDDPGWPQNSKTRNIMLDTLQQQTIERGYRLYDELTLRELASLTWKKTANMRRARAEAAPGAHDDCVFALGLGLCTAHEALSLHRRKFGAEGARVLMINQGLPVDGAGRRIESIRSYI